MKKYFKYRWNENRGDEFDDWGFSTWYNEVDEKFYTIRQIEIYDNGNILKYCNEHLEDKFGALAEKSLEESSAFLEISQVEFENIWNSQKTLNS